MSDEIASATLQTSQKAIEVALELIKMLAPLAKQLLSEVYHKSVDGINDVGGKIANARSLGTVSAKNLVVEAQKANSPISTTSNFLARDAEQIVAKAKQYKIPIAIIGNGEKRTIEFLERDKGAIQQSRKKKIVLCFFRLPRCRSKRMTNSAFLRLQRLRLCNLSMKRSCLPTPEQTATI